MNHDCSLDNLCLSILSYFIRHGGFYGSDTHPEHGCRRSDNYLKGLPLHEYEIDMDKQEVLDREERTSKMSMQSTASSTG